MMLARRPSPRLWHEKKSTRSKVTCGSTRTRRVLASAEFVDFYELLGVEEEDTQEDIKSSYRKMAKFCHPDIAGDQGHDMCVMLNEAYSTLTDPERKREYDERRALYVHDVDAGYTGDPLSKWCGPGHPMSKCTTEDQDTAVFVDEGTCIGCTNCVHTASATFRLEKEYGRARVFAQWVNTKDQIQEAIDTCPVNCIHWVERDQLPALEYCMREKVNRVNVGVMMAGQGSVDDVFQTAVTFVRKREELVKEREKKRYYSRAQEKARAEAAEEIRKRMSKVQKASDWFEGLFESVRDSLKDQGLWSSRGRHSVPLHRAIVVHEQDKE